MAHVDTSSGTPVTLVVSPGKQVVPPPHKHPLPFTGFALVPALVLALVLLAVGSVLLVGARRPVPVRIRHTSPR